LGQREFRLPKEIVETLRESPSFDPNKEDVSAAKKLFTGRPIELEVRHLIELQMVL